MNTDIWIFSITLAIDPLKILWDGLPRKLALIGKWQETCCPDAAISRIVKIA